MNFVPSSRSEIRDTVAGPPRSPAKTLAQPQPHTPPQRPITQPQYHYQTYDKTPPSRGQLPHESFIHSFIHSRPRPYHITQTIKLNKYNAHNTTNKNNNIMSQANSPFSHPLPNQPTKPKPKRRQRSPSVRDANE